MAMKILQRLVMAVTCGVMVLTTGCGSSVSYRTDHEHCIRHEVHRLFGVPMDSEDYVCKGGG
jgi:hypothetical protein